MLCFIISRETRTPLKAEDILQWEHARTRTRMYICPVVCFHRREDRVRLCRRRGLRPLETHGGPESPFERAGCKQRSLPTPPLTSHGVFLAHAHCSSAGSLRHRVGPRLQGVEPARIRGSEGTSPLLARSYSPPAPRWSPETAIGGLFSAPSPCGLTFRFLARRLRFSLLPPVYSISLSTSCMCVSYPPLHSHTASTDP